MGVGNGVTRWATSTSLVHDAKASRSPDLFPSAGPPICSLPAGIHRCWSSISQCRQKISCSRTIRGQRIYLRGCWVRKPTPLKTQPIIVMGPGDAPPLPCPGAFPTTVGEAPAHFGKGITEKDPNGSPIIRAGRSACAEGRALQDAMVPPPHDPAGWRCPSPSSRWMDFPHRSELPGMGHAAGDASTPGGDWSFHTLSCS